MKYLCALVLLMVLGCGSKADKKTSKDLDQEDLVGTWQLEATKISPGFPVDWSTANSEVRYVFRSDGTFDYRNPNVATDNMDGTFSVKDAKLHLHMVQRGRKIDMQYHAMYSDDTLILEYVGCIEECKTRYKREH